MAILSCWRERLWTPRALVERPAEPPAPACLAARFLSLTLQGGALTMVEENALNWTGPDGLRPRIRATGGGHHD